MFIRMLRHIPNPNQRGAAAIEFAVVVLLLLIILFGIMEFSFTFLQRHFVANAAREGVRIGIRAQNYNCFDAAGIPCSGGNLSDRGVIVKNLLTDCTTNPKGYLCTLYQSDMARVEVEFDPLPIEDSDPKTLTVTVSTPNFFPSLISSLVPGYEYPATLSYSASGNYENAAEP